MKAEAYISEAFKLLENYSPPLPLRHFFSKYVLRDKRFGSRDRKILRHLIYSYFRLGHFKDTLPKKDAILLGIFLNDEKPHPAVSEELETLVPFPRHDGLTIDEKFRLAQEKYGLTEEKIFPFLDEISSHIDKKKFVHSFFERPKVYARPHPKFRNAFHRELLDRKVKFEKLENDIYAFNPEVRLTDLKSAKRGYFEVQDLNSQKSLDSIEAKEGELWWDCCAGAGGKSLLFKSKFPNARLFVTDNRKSILNNLKERFLKAGITDYKAEVIDLEQPAGALKNDMLENELKFDGIIMDAPCSGSGTWVRNPERISNFKLEELQHFQQKQITIAKNVLPFLKPGKSLVYITCSVFKKENEAMIEKLKANLGLEVKEMKYLTGYDKRAETLFVTIFN